MRPGPSVALDFRFCIVLWTIRLTGCAIPFTVPSFVHTAAGISSQQDRLFPAARVSGNIGAAFQHDGTAGVAGRLHIPTAAIQHRGGTRMQRDTLQHRVAGLSCSGGTFLFEEAVEANGIRAGGHCSDDRQEWHSHRDADAAGELCRSWISVREPASPGRGGVFYDWIVAAGSCVLVVAAK